MNQNNEEFIYERDYKLIFYIYVVLFSKFDGIISTKVLINYVIVHSKKMSYKIFYEILKHLQSNGVIALGSDYVSGDKIVLSNDGFFNYVKVNSKPEGNDFQKACFRFKELMLQYGRSDLYKDKIANLIKDIVHNTNAICEDCRNVFVPLLSTKYCDDCYKKKTHKICIKCRKNEVYGRVKICNECKNKVKENHKFICLACGQEGESNDFRTKYHPKCKELVKNKLQCKNCKEFDYAFRIKKGICKRCQLELKGFKVNRKDNSVIFTCSCGRDFSIELDKVRINWNLSQLCDRCLNKKNAFERKCRGCKKGFTPHAISQRYCDVCSACIECKKLLKPWDEKPGLCLDCRPKKEKKEKVEKVKDKVVKICKGCGLDFEVEKSNQRYCFACSHCPECGKKLPAWIKRDKCLSCGSKNRQKRDVKKSVVTHKTQMFFKFEHDRTSVNLTNISHYFIDEKSMSIQLYMMNNTILNLALSEDEMKRLSNLTI